MQTALNTATERKPGLIVPWSAEEDDRLRHMRETLGMGNIEIAQNLRGRTTAAVMHRIARLGLKSSKSGQIQQATGWLAWEDEALKQGIEQGLTFKEIGAKLKRTKNACIGRAYRTGLIQSGAAPKEPNGEAPKEPNGERLPGNAGMAMPTRKTCAWPIGHPGDEGFHFCGGKPVTGRPYCDAHCHVAYTTYANGDRPAGEGARHDR